MKLPLISVIVPVYNKAQYVGKLIKCIQDQTFDNYECIIIDDGSTDESGSVCDDMTAGNDSFSVIHIPNGGVSHARNIALDRATGEYITFLDADDEIPTDYLQRIADDIRTYQVDMVIGAIKKITEHGEEVVQYPFEERVYTMQELLPHFAQAQKDSGVFGWCVNKTFKRELAMDCRFDESLKLSEDFDFYLKIYKNVKTIYFNCHNYYHYLYERGGFNATLDSDIDYLSQAKVQIRLKEFLKEAGFWNDANEQIVSARIQEYLFFAVYHCSSAEYYACFTQTHELYKSVDITDIDSSYFRHIVLKCIENNDVKLCRVIISIRKVFSILTRRR